jgi:integrase
VVARQVDLPGAAHLVLDSGVRYLDPAPAVFEAMLEGWERQQKSRFLSEDGTITDAFRDARQEAGLPKEPDVHALRHSYVTHLLEFGYPALIMQQQVGHAWGSTTAQYQCRISSAIACWNSPCRPTPTP